MIKQEQASEESWVRFHSAALLWKSLFGYMENELQFIKKLLNARAFKASTPNLFERLEHFKNEIDSKTRELTSLELEVKRYEIYLKGILECEDISCDTFYRENHEALENRVNEFQTAFDEYKNQVFNYTGGVL